MHEHIKWISIHDCEWVCFGKVAPNWQLLPARTAHTTLKKKRTGPFVSVVFAVHFFFIWIAATSNNILWVSCVHDFSDLKCHRWAMIWMLFWASSHSLMLMFGLFHSGNYRPFQYIHAHKHARATAHTYALNASRRARIARAREYATLLFGNVELRFRVCVRYVCHSWWRSIACQP